MGRGMEVVAGFATNPGAVLTTLTPSTNTSFTVRGTDTTKNAWLVNAFAFTATAGEFLIKSPRLHDNVQGIRNRSTAAFVPPLFNTPNNPMARQRLYAQDNLTVQISGGGAEIDSGAIIIYYEDLAGVAARFVDYATILKSGLNLVTAEVTVTAVVTGNFGGAVAINSTFDTLKANTDYAILGGITDTRGTAVRITGVDLGNLGVGFPAEPTIRDVTNNWFVGIAQGLGLPAIPVINSANKSAITIDVATNQAGGTYIINLELLEMAAGSVSATGL
jgi:hypothetical protein